MEDGGEKEGGREWTKVEEETVVKKTEGSEHRYG